MQLRMYKYRVYPSKVQQRHIIQHLITSKEAYNSLLENSIAQYKENKKTLNRSNYYKMVKGKYHLLHSQVAQNVGDRVHKSFQNFFRRVKNKSCKKKGFPRFKSRVQSITYPQSGFKFLSDKRLSVSKIGNIPIVLSRLPKGKIKTMTIKQNEAGQFHAIFSCEMPDTTITHPSTEKVGIDVGLENFATLSNGEQINNPRHLRMAERRLKHLQRSVSRKKKGSKNRAKARHKLAIQHLKIANQRDDFLHKLSHSFTQQYHTIAVENLNIKNMVQSHYLAKSIHDASWNRFIQMLSYKAVTSGGELIKVNPRGTSKTCNQCGKSQDMPLHKREYHCECGYKGNRDVNASINILNRGIGMDYAKSTPVDNEPLLQSTEASSLNEAGTIFDTS